MFDKSFNIIKKIKRNFFPFYKNKELRFVFNKLQEGLPKDTIAARFVGGCVRKHLSSDEIDDIDIATILSSDDIKEKFKNTDFRIVDTGIKHGTITLISKKFKLELTTLRKDLETDGRHAEVEYINNWQLDSERRDFTINAIYLDINGNIFDPQNGKTDLKNKIVKFIGDPQKRIEEDYLRIIRFIRFKIMYNFEIEPTTCKAIKLNLNGIKKISKERILVELYKILGLKNFIYLNESTELKEIFTLIFPEFKNLRRLERLIKICDYSQLNMNLLLATLLIDDQETHEYFGHKYNISNNLKENLNSLAKDLKLIKENKSFFDKELERNIYMHNKNYLINLNILNYVINPNIKFKVFSDILSRILKSKTHKFNIDGKYLIKNGMKQGSIMGKVLREIEKEWLKNNFQITKERVKEIIRSHKS